MNTNDYLIIFYTGIVENAKHLKGYIERERKKAEKVFVEADEFFDNLTNATNSIKDHFQFKHAEQLNNHYMAMDSNEATPDGKKTDYTKNLPDINGIGLPLLSYTGQKYTGHFYFSQVEQFENALIEVKQNAGKKLQTPSKSKLDFTKDKLKIIILQLANLNGYEQPSTYLNELLDEIKQFDSFEFECDFFLNIHYLCVENIDKFWSECHRKDISKWLKKAPIITDVFETTWKTVMPEPISTTETKQQTTFVTDYLFGLKDFFNSEKEYLEAVGMVYSFFNSDGITIKKPIFVKNGCTKKLAFAMGEIWRSQKNEPLTYEYLLLYKRVFSIFNKQTLDKENLFGNNLYKYSISKT